MLIRIVDLEVHAYHGVYKEEKEKGQRFLICAELELSREAGADRLSATVDYASVSRYIAAQTKANPCDLIETAAENLALFLLIKYPALSRVGVEVKKPEAPVGLPLGYVSAVAERKRSSVYIGLGSNLGDREKTLNAALEELAARPDCRVARVSGFSYTKPYGKTDQPDFLNGVAEISTVLDPAEFLRVLQEIENRYGRVRTEKWGPRTLDLDILFFGGAVINTRGLTVPHPDLHNRLFVLEPLCALDPALIHPVFQKSVSALLSALTENQGKVKQPEHQA